MRGDRLPGTKRAGVRLSPWTPVGRTLLMNVIAQHQDRVLLSIGPEDLREVITALQSHSSTAAQGIASRLQSQLRTAPHAVELAEAWADGGSVQVRAISIWGDPLDLGDGEAREFAARILKAVGEAE